MARFASDKLREIQSRLQVHFATLRDARRGRTPIFALEHGLDPDEITELQDEVRKAVRENGRGLLTASLAFIVHATELGYEYSGDEYWHSFMRATPGWPEAQAAEWLARHFQQDFVDPYDGAKIGGTWALHFNRIAWPITHAVLPKDLQRELLDLLYNSRGAFSGEILASPSALGAFLGARAEGSSRFTKFAQNRELLGVVASALTRGEADSEILLPATLDRIVRDLTRERDARNRLRDVRSRSASVRTVGFAPQPVPAADQGQDPRTPRSATARVKTELEGTAKGWRMRVKLPNLVDLLAADDDTKQALMGSRYRVAGRNGWLPKRTLALPPRPITLDEWPRGTGWVSLETDPRNLNDILAERLALAPKPFRLFKIDGVGSASELAGTVVRPGAEYLWLGTQTPHVTAGWITEQPSAVAGATLMRHRIPPQPSPDDAAVLGPWGLQLGHTVRVRPAGHVADRWEGEGYAEWLIGEDVLLSIDLGGAHVLGLLQLGDQVAVLRPEPGSTEAFVHVAGLPVGEHTAGVSLEVGGIGRPVAETFTICVREPAPTDHQGTWQHAISIESDPVRPSIEELWNGEAAVCVEGPKGVRATLNVSFSTSESDGVLQDMLLDLPVRGREWMGVLARLRKDRSFEDMLQLADTATLRVSNPRLGTASLKTTREFVPLRFLRRKRLGQVRLVAHTSQAPVVTRYDFDNPAEAKDVSGESVWVPTSTSMLLVARSGDLAARTVISPDPAKLTVGTRQRTYPWVPRIGRGVSDVTHLIGIASEWGATDVPPDPFGRAQRRDVLRVMTREIVTMLAGTRAWSNLEHAYASGFDERLWRREIAVSPLHEDFARRSAGRVRLWPEMDVAARVEDFAHIVESCHLFDERVAGVLSRGALVLASAPHVLRGLDADELDFVVRGLLGEPVVVRAARFGVMLVDDEVDDDEWTTHGGWQWS